MNARDELLLRLKVEQSMMKRSKTSSLEVELSEEELAIVLSALSREESVEEALNKVGFTTKLE